MTRRLIASFLIFSFIISLSAIGFAAGSQGPERYSIQLKGLDVHNADTNTWYHLMKVTNSVDIVYLNSNPSVNGYFSAKGLPQGNYDKIRVVFGNVVTYRGHYFDGIDDYWTKPNPVFSGESVIANGVDSVHDFPSNYDTNYTIQSGDITQADAHYKGLNANNGVYFNGTGSSASPSYAANDIIIKLAQPFALSKQQVKHMTVSWGIDSALGFDTISKTFGFDFPAVTVNVN